MRSLPAVQWTRTARCCACWASTNAYARGRASRQTSSSPGRGGAESVSGTQAYSRPAAANSSSWQRRPSLTERTAPMPPARSLSRSQGSWSGPERPASRPGMTQKRWSMMAFFVASISLTGLPTLVFSLEGKPRVGRGALCLLCVLVRLVAWAGAFTVSRRGSTRKKRSTSLVRSGSKGSSWSCPRGRTSVASGLRSGSGVSGSSWSETGWRSRSSPFSSRWSKGWPAQIPRNESGISTTSRKAAGSGGSWARRSSTSSLPGRGS